MTISYNWLCDYIKTTASIDETVQILTAVGLEVERAETQDAVKGGLRGVVVGKTLTCEPHPNSDHMHVATVDVGEPQPLQIVCGAPNIAAGQKVFVATAGTTLYFDDKEIKIKKSKLRGIDSCGMICAEDELGLGTSHEGIMVLPDDAVVGTPAAEFLNLQSDTILEIGLTPNRIDAASHIGVARDLAAYLVVHYPEKLQSFACPSVERFKTDDASLPIKVQIENTEACPRYTGVSVSGVMVVPSPQWLQQRLTAIGVRPVNNIVDAANFVMYEIGQPLHAFDADKIDGNLITVRTCNEGDTFKTLDNMERRLSAQDLMICSADKPLCIAGVFGGAESGITERTTRIFIESACFNPVWIRRTARRHALSTDASFRYERGADISVTPYALKRAALLIQEIAGGKVSSDITDEYPAPQDKKRIKVDYAYLDSIAGQKIPPAMCRKILEALEYGVEEENEHSFVAVAPYYRFDVRQSCDIAEDILRIYGYDNIKIPSQIKSVLNSSTEIDNKKWINKISDFLTCNGFNEMVNHSFDAVSYYENLQTYPVEKLVSLKNPSNEFGVMRQTLLFGGLRSAARSIRRRQTNLHLYELGNVYSVGQVSGSAAERYAQERQLGIWVTGLDSEKRWNRAAEAADFFTLKAIVEKLLQQLGIDIAALQTESVPYDIFADGIEYRLMGKPFAELGAVSGKICKAMDIKQDVYYAQLRWNVLMAYLERQRFTSAEPPKYPEVRRDLSLLLDREVTFACLHAIALKNGKPFLQKVSLFDVYEGEKLPADKKSYALSFILQATEKTLTDREIDVVMQRIAAAFERECGAALRA